MKMLTKLLIATSLWFCRERHSSPALTNVAPASTDPDWSELITSRQNAHGRGAIQPTGNSDVDFVRLMLPHHQAALDMAKTQLYGKDANAQAGQKSLPISN